jgi:hypothetical protein
LKSLLGDRSAPPTHNDQTRNKAASVGGLFLLVLACFDPWWPVLKQWANLIFIPGAFGNKLVSTGDCPT